MNFFFRLDSCLRRNDGEGTGFLVGARNDGRMSFLRKQESRGDGEKRDWIPCRSKE